MGRVFTIIFDYRNEQHIGVVTVCDQAPEEPVYYVRFYNPELQKIVPGGRIRFLTSDNSVPNSLQDPKAQELFMGIKDAVCRYLQAKPKDEEATLNNVHHDEHTDTRTG